MQKQSKVATCVSVIGSGLSLCYTGMSRVFKQTQPTQIKQSNAEPSQSRPKEAKQKQKQGQQPKTKQKQSIRKSNSNGKSTSKSNARQKEICNMCVLAFGSIFALLRYFVSSHAKPNKAKAGNSNQKQTKESIPSNAAS